MALPASKPQVRIDMMVIGPVGRELYLDS